MIFLRRYKCYIKNGTDTTHQYINGLMLIYKLYNVLEFYYYHTKGCIGVRRKDDSLRYYIETIGTKYCSALSLSIEFINCYSHKIDAKYIRNKKIHSIYTKKLYLTTEFIDFDYRDGHLSYQIKGYRRFKI